MSARPTAPARPEAYGRLERNTDDEILPGQRVFIIPMGADGLALHEQVGCPVVEATNPEVQARALRSKYGLHGVKVVVVEGPEGVRDLALGGTAAEEAVEAAPRTSGRPDAVAGQPGPEEEPEGAVGPGDGLEDEPEKPGPAPTLTDTGNASRLVALHGDRLHFIPPWGKWIVWDADAGCWVVDHRDVHVRELAKDVGQIMKQEAARTADADAARKIFAFAFKSLNSHGITGMVNLARGVEGIPLDHEALDADGWLLGFENGTMDLRTGTFRPSDPADLITRQCPARWDPDAEAPRWEQALREWFPDPEVRAYVQRVAGAALVGGQREHVFTIHYGLGGNGKGTFTRGLQRVLGPLAVEIHLSLLVETRHKEHDTVKADLFRSRLAVAVETDRRVKLAEASVKNLTGGDRIRARKMREDPWAFDPTHSLWLQTNHLPEIAGRDEGIWRRIRVVKWEAAFRGGEADPTLDDTLAAEAPGILRWLVEGCMEWQEHGLDEPEAVIRDTLAYREKEDVFSRFQTDTGLVFRPTLQVEAKELQDLLLGWANEEGVDAPTQEVGDWLREHGCQKKQVRVTDPDGKQRRPRVWVGVGIEGQGHETEQTDALV